MTGKTIFTSLVILLTLSASVWAASKEYQSLAAKLVGEAEAALTEQDVDKADELANLALTADPANAGAYIAKARAQEAKGDSAQSLRLVGIGLDIEPDNIAALDFQGVVALKMGDVEQAEKTLKKLQIVCPENCPETDKLKAALEAAQGDTEKQADN